MSIIYISCTGSKKKFNKLFKESKQMPGQQVQKYHRLIMEGIVRNDVKLKTVTALPVNSLNYEKKIVKEDSDEDNSVQYTYLTTVNIPIIKNLLVMIGAFLRTLKFLKEDKQAAIVCDVLNISISAGALLAAKILKRNNVGIVTDIPVFLSGNSDSFKIKLNNFIINNFDSYVFLTEQMNEVINKRKVPYVVIEGQVDIRMSDIENNIRDKYEQKVCIYAGGLQKIYGIKKFTDAFIKANIHGAELHIYGDGDFQDELVKICKNHRNIKYFGVVPNDDVVEAELKATLLINPRPSSEEFTKYSFPSKNMEYMVSGTPVLTTSLPGMPKEYTNYVYMFENETLDGMVRILQELLMKSDEELYKMGEKAKDFVLKEKNNVRQSKRIVNMIESKQQGSIA